MTTRRHLLLGMLGGTAALAGCATDQQPTVESPTPSPSPSKKASPKPSPSPSPSPAPVTRAPLTWLPVEDAATLLGPAVAVKVPNLKQENPQTAGFADADMWFCQPNGDSYTRLVPVFHSRYPAAVGPIRSMRPVDVPLLSPMGPVLGNTGAAEWVMNYVKAHDEHLERMTYLEWRDKGAYSVDRSRIYKANGKSQFDRAIMAHPAEMARLAERMTAPPPADYLPFVADPAQSSATAGSAGHRVEVPYGRDFAMSYEYDPGSRQYARTQPWGPHIVEGDIQLVCDNVLIIQAAWRMDKIWKGGGAADPVVDIVDNSGPFFYLQGGKAVTGTWAKGAIAEKFTFTVAGGRPLAMAPGRTWVELPHTQSEIAIS